MSLINTNEIAEHIYNFPQKSCQGLCNLKCLTIVLDLDETLIRTFYENEKVPIPNNHPDYFSFYIKDVFYEGMKRPNLDRFLRRIYKIASKIIIFTAAKPEYAEKVINVIFANMPYRPDHVFTYLDCKVSPNFIKKPLDLVFKRFPNEVSLERTIVFDDKHCVYFSDDVRNVVQVKPFKGEINDNFLEDAYYHVKYLWKKELKVYRINHEKNLLK